MPCALLLFSHTCLPAATAVWDSGSLWATGRLLLLLLSTADLCVSHLYLTLIFISHCLHLSPREALLLPSCCDYVSGNISAFCSLPVCVCVCVSLMVILCVLTLARLQFMSFIMWPRMLSGERVCVCRTMCFRVSIFHKQLHRRDDE